MRTNIYFYFMHTHVLFIFSLVLLWFNTTTGTSFRHQLVAATRRAANTCIDKERQALLDFKSQVHDPKNRLSKWRPDDDCCQWEEITCNNQTGHITEFYLGYYGLGGKISHSLLNLSYLNHLGLMGNHFYGTIPKFICSMTHLTFLSLSLNEFTGTLPESICNMTQLTHLDLSYNSFYGTIPESIGKMTQLTYLDLHANNFSGVIPRSISSMTKLECLQLSQNLFYGTIPPEFGNLTNLDTLSLGSLRSCTVENLDWLSSLSYLQQLTLAGTSLAKVSNWVNVIIGLQNLNYLNLGECDLSQVMNPYSSSVNSSSSINHLFLASNNLNSSMYRWLCPLVGNWLIQLILSDNKFDGNLSDFLNNLSGCTSGTLEVLDASSNQLAGSLSDEIQNFSSLMYLSLSLNQLDGNISDKLWELPWLEELNLSSNSLRGAISENIGKSNLFSIDLSNNSLEGAPSNDDVPNVSMTVEYIDFSSNKLGPRFPKFIQIFKNLTHLDLSNNRISDTVSTEQWNQWRSSQFMTYFDLSFNNISGTLPKSLPFSELDLIDMSYNSFYGPIPAFPARVRFVDLSRNKFHGGISFLCQMYENLEFLDLSRNSLTGKLANCSGNWPHLKVLNLGHNTLSGSLPPFVGYLGQLETMCLYNNKFSGELPSSLKNCTNLSLLDLGANNLYGTIPVWIGENLSRLYALSLNSNNFFGDIPSQICQLVSVQILDLSFNNLSGTIPSCVNNLTSMVQKGYISEQNVHHYLRSRHLSRAHYYDEGVDSSYIDRLLIKWQGRVNEFSSILGLLKAIDLSSNNLTGQIPNEVTNLHGLLVLDLSNNSLVGKIPQDIGQMVDLLTLNLSRNMFSGEMPSSMSEMHSLNDLDVSFNNLSGRVPSSTQLQSFEPSRYNGNAGLCGPPLTKYCPGDKVFEVTPEVDERKSDGEAIDELQR